MWEHCHFVFGVLLKCEGGKPCVDFSMTPPLNADQSYFNHPDAKTITPSEIISTEDTFARYWWKRECDWYNDILRNSVIEFPRGADVPTIELIHKRQQRLLYDFNELLSNGAWMPTDKIWRLCLKARKFFKLFWLCGPRPMSPNKVRLVKRD
jgi:hypothetical protein